MRVDTAVPNFWLDVVRLEPRLIALAVASPALAVRVTTGAFGIATRARKAPLAVRSFVEVKDALTWVSLQVRLAKAAPPEGWRTQG